LLRPSGVSPKIEISFGASGKELWRQKKSAQWTGFFTS